MEGEKPILHQDTHINPACGVGVNIQLVLADCYRDIQSAAEQRMREITLEEIVLGYHWRLEQRWPGQEQKDLGKGGA